MPSERYQLGVAALDNKIYVTGGYGVDYLLYGQSMSSVDCYDPDTYTWSQMENMSIARHGHSLVSLHGRLYAIGGARVDSVEVYDPDNKTWTILQLQMDGDVCENGAGLIKKYHVE